MQVTFIWIPLMLLLLACTSNTPEKESPPGDDSATVVDRGPTTIAIDGDPNGLWWADGQLTIADDDNNRILQWTDAAGIGLVGDLPPAAAEGAGLGQVIVLDDGTRVVSRFGYGTTGDVVTLSAAGVGAVVPGLDVERRRIGLALAADGRIFVSWFISGDAGRVGAVSLLDLAGTETDALPGLIKPVGGDQLVAVDVRVVAATNADLESMVARGLFREDLLRRLDAVTLQLPPLRERPEDITLLAEHYYRGLVPGLGADWASAEVVEALSKWPWPGNIRELGNVMARAAAESGGRPLEVDSLGPLSPRERRLSPVLSTASDDSWLRAEAFAQDRGLCHRITAVSLRLLPVRERPFGSIRNAVLFLLDGHPIRVEAMRVLERYPWWGNWTELEAVVAAMKANIGGLIDREALQRTLPHLFQTGQEPIRVLLYPQVQSGGLSGFQQDVHEEALLVGRVGSLAEAQQIFAEDPGGSARLAALRSRTTVCLNLGHLPQLSRLHFLLSREPEGLKLTVLEGARLPVWGSSLQQPLQVVRPGESAFLGRAGEVVVRMDGGPVYLHLLVFAGAIAQDEAADQVMSRLGSRPSRPGPTIEIGKLELPKTDPEPKAADPKSSEPRILVWELSEEEREWLAGIVAGFEGGEFKSALENAPRSSPGLARITRYLASTRPTQYAGRLYEHPTNQLLRQRTVELLVDRPDLDAHLERLPTAIRRALDGLLS